MRSFSRLALLGTLLVPLFSCAEGGSDERPISEVQLSQTLHFLGMTAVGQFSAFPLPTTEVNPFDGQLLLNSDSTYRIRQGSLDAALGTYALETDGTLSIFIPQTGRPTIVWRGAYGLEGDTRNFFLTDRVGGSIGMFFGSELLTGTPDPNAFAGKWHVASLHALFAPGGSAPSQDRVTRSLGGTVTVAADGTITGTGSDSRSPSATLSLGGNLALFDDGRFTADLEVGDPVDETRAFRGGGNDRFLFAVDEDESDGDAGVLAMFRERSAVADPAEVAGTYDVGLITLFADPFASGTDAALGTLEINATGDFVLEARNNSGTEFDITGSLTHSATDFGAFDVTVPASSETWFGAVDEGYDTLFMIDRVLEVRPGSPQSELNFIVAIRRAVPPPPTPEGN